MADTTLRGIRKVRLVTERIGHEILWLRSVESTNEAAWREAERGGEDGLVVMAEEQTAGRGRMGREWICPPGCGVLASVVLRPEGIAETASLLTVCGALAVRDVAADLSGVPATIRWPNDVLLGGRKTAGILVESRPGIQPATFILGLGLNVNQKESDFPDAIRGESTSLDLASGRRVDRLVAAQRLVEALDGWYVRLIGGHAEQLAAAWRDASAVLRRRVEVQLADETCRGVVEDLDPREGIFLRLDRGGILRLRGERVVRLRLLEDANTSVAGDGRSTDGIDIRGS